MYAHVKEWILNVPTYMYNDCLNEWTSLRINVGTLVLYNPRIKVHTFNNKYMLCRIAHMHFYRYVLRYKTDIMKTWNHIDIHYMSYRLEITTGFCEYQLCSLSTWASANFQSSMSDIESKWILLTLAGSCVEPADTGTGVIGHKNADFRTIKIKIPVRNIIPDTAISWHTSRCV